MVFCIYIRTHISVLALKFPFQPYCTYNAYDHYNNKKTCPSNGDSYCHTIDSRIWNMENIISVTYTYGHSYNISEDSQLVSWVARPQRSNNMWPLHDMHEWVIYMYIYSSYGIHIYIHCTHTYIRTMEELLCLKKITESCKRAYVVSYVILVIGVMCCSTTGSFPRLTWHRWRMLWVLHPFVAHYVSSPMIFRPACMYVSSCLWTGACVPAQVHAGVRKKCWKSMYVCNLPRLPLSCTVWNVYPINCKLKYVYMCHFSTFLLSN